jgi:Fe-S oxidoreductase
VNLFPDDALARRLSESVVLFGEFLDSHRDQFTFDSLDRSAIVQAHCHQAAVLNMDADVRVLREMLGVDARVLDSGCCGMAGAFGFEAEHYEISQRCAERVLLPAVRQSPADALIVANGFSCREQIVQGTGRMPVHLANVAQMAVRA